jgi:hypothetical protein
MKKNFLPFLFCLFTLFSFSQNNSLWEKVTTITNNSKVKTSNKTIKNPQVYSLNIESLIDELIKV